MASILGAASVWLGLEGSLKWDTPAGPSIVVAALVFSLYQCCPCQSSKDRKMKTITPAVPRRYKTSEK